MAPTPAPCARASVGGALLAESDDPVRTDVADGPPRLWFPRASVVDSELGRLPADAWEGGEGSLTDHVAFDHEQVDITLVDEWGDGATTTTRFPAWGDTADLVRVLDVRPGADGAFVSEARSDWRRPVVEASQILGQSIVAAGRQAPGRRAVSVSMVFPRAADARRPYSIGLDEVTDGRTFTVLEARATQGERTCALGTLLLDVTAPDVIRHAEPPPAVGPPTDAVPYDMGVSGRDLRIVDAAYTGDPDAPVGPPEISVWVRFRSVPDDQAIHAGLLAQMTGHMSIAAALRPHAGVGQDHAHSLLSTGVNAISLSIHADVRADRWLLYHHRSTSAAHGMAHSECRVHDEHGDLVASFTTDCMVRGFGDSAPRDARTAL